MRSSIPMILVTMGKVVAISQNFLLDKWWEPKGRSVCHKFVVESESFFDTLGGYWGKFSHGGLVVFDGISNGKVVILNPTSNKNVTITLSKELHLTSICGVFFHPVLREYCTLWHRYLGGIVYYMMLNLGSKPCWRDISNPWSHRVKMGDIRPVLIGGYLYWLVKPDQERDYSGRGDIMEFDIRSEKLGLMRCPVPSGVYDVRSSRINLLDIESIISFVLTTKNENMVNVNIWKLKDGAQQSWVYMKHSMRVEDCSNSGVPLPMATAVVGDQMVLSFAQRLYVCNMKLGTSWTFHMKEGMRRAFLHVMSLASLKDCKSNISMNNEGEVLEEPEMA